MSDSESDEQFESADEDLDFEADIGKSTSCQSNNYYTRNISNNLSNLTLTLKEYQNVEKSGDILDIKNKSQEKEPDETLGTEKRNVQDTIENSSCNIIKDDQSISSKNIISKTSGSNEYSAKEANTVKTIDVKESSLKPSTLQNNNPIPLTKNESEESECLQSSEKTTKDILNTKIEEPNIDTNCDGWDIDIDDVVNHVTPNITSDNVVETKTSSKCSDSSKNTVSNKGDGSTFSKEVTSPPGDASVDGWDVEVEDGFEIPVDLTKCTNVTSTERFPFSITSPLQKLTDSKEDSWGAWNPWGGVGNILSTATSGVTTITSQVSQGFSQVLGAPDPAELAKLDKQLSEHKTEHQHNTPQHSQNTDYTSSSSTQDTAGSVHEAGGNKPQGSAGIFSLSQLTRLVETTGSKVIAGGLDTLENLGKKTMEVLQDGDPGLKKKRAILFPNQDKPVLSQVLKEAKGRHETEDKTLVVASNEEPAHSTGTTNIKNLHFESLLDYYQGLAHLEALEILSKQCSVRLHTALMAKSGDDGQAQDMKDFQETLQQIREMCQVEDTSEPDDTDNDDDDVMGFDEKIEEIVRLYDLSSKLNCDKLIQVNKKMTLQVDRVPLETSCDVLYEQCLRSMAEFTSVAMDMFHKSASLLLLKSKHRTVDETDALTQFTHLLCSRITSLSSVYSQAMVKLDRDSGLVTNVYLEAANSCSYLQDASQLLIPVLQTVAISGAS